MTGAGVALIDFDNDGQFDFLLCVISSGISLKPAFEIRHAFRLRACVIRKVLRRKRIFRFIKKGNEQFIRIGFGAAEKIDKLEIVWVNGQAKAIPVSKIVTLLVFRQEKAKFRQPNSYKTVFPIFLFFEFPKFLPRKAFLSAKTPANYNFVSASTGSRRAADYKRF